MLVCSLCIRKWLDVNQFCPVCKKSTDASTIYNNRALDALVQVFKDEMELIEPTIQRIQFVLENGDVDSRMKEVMEVDSVPKVEVPVVVIPTDKSSCPVCGVLIKKDFLNSHVNLCLKKSSSNLEASPSNAKKKVEESDLKHLPKLPYHVMSDKQIRKALADHGLSDKGKRQDLIWRHKEFVNQYNANLDSLNPQSINQVKASVAKVEVEIRTPSTPAKSSSSRPMDFFLSKPKPKPKSPALMAEPVKKIDPLKDVIQNYRRERKKRKREQIEQEETPEITPSTFAEPLQMSADECAPRSKSINDEIDTFQEVNDVAEKEVSSFQCSANCSWIPSTHHLFVYCF
jgi:hypothetical protein